MGTDAHFALGREDTLGEDIIHELAFLFENSFRNRRWYINWIKNIRGDMTSCCYTQLLVDDTPLRVILKLDIIGDINLDTGTKRRS